MCRFVNRNRFYSPDIGRFISSDPLGMVDGPNTYGFCGGDPVNRVDPMGTTFATKLADVLVTAIKEATPDAIKKYIRDNMTENFYRRYNLKLREAGAGAFYQVHHILAQKFFKDPELAAWFEKLGIRKNGAKNVVGLPTPEGVAKGKTRAAEASMHKGGHVAEYFEYVKKELLDIKRAHDAGELTDDIAQKAIEDLQYEIRGKLKRGEIKLHNYDTPASREALQLGTATAFGLLLFAGSTEAEAGETVMVGVESYLENERYYREKNVFIRYGTAEFYTRDSDSKVAKWATFAVDMINPVEDVMFVTDLAEDGLNDLDAYDRFKATGVRSGAAVLPFSTMNSAYLDLLFENANVQRGLGLMLRNHQKGWKFLFGAPKVGELGGGL